MRLHEIIAYRSLNLVVHKNPSKAQFTNLMAGVDRSHGEGLRGIIDSGDLYVWDGYQANHDEIVTQLGLGEGIDVHLWTVYVQIDISNAEGEDRKAVGNQYASVVGANKSIQRIYGADPRIQIEDGYSDWWAP